MFYHNLLEKTVFEFVSEATNLPVKDVNRQTVLSPEKRDLVCRWLVIKFEITIELKDPDDFTVGQIIDAVGAAL